jgi:hypothetical protein
MVKIGRADPVGSPLRGADSTRVSRCAPVEGSMLDPARAAILLDSSTGASVIVS